MFSRNHLVFVALLCLTCFAMGITPVRQCLAQGHSCDGCSEDWHQHPWDGYWQAWWKIIDWDDNIVNQQYENTLFDDWDRLLFVNFKNDDCDPITVEVDRTTTFTHSVTINWGGEITAELEVAGELLFASAKVAVGAKVDWHRSGTSIKEETIKVKQTKQMSECKKIDFYYDVRRLKKRWEYEVAEALFDCKNFDSGEVKTYFCNRRVVQITAQGYHEATTGWTNSKKICKCLDGVATPLNDGN